MGAYLSGVTLRHPVSIPIYQGGTMKIILLLLALTLLLLPTASVADALGDREGGEPLIDLVWWMRRAAATSPIPTWLTWDNVWNVVGVGEWWR